MLLNFEENFPQKVMQYSNSGKQRNNTHDDQSSVRQQRREQMNWKLFVLLLITLVVLVACSEDDQTEDTNVTAEDQETETEQKTNSSNESNSGESITEESVDQAELQPVTEVEITEASEPRDLEEYIEMDRVMKDVDVDSHALHVVTDHPGKRVIIYTKDEEQLYKSVYVKRNALFKLIDLQKSKPVAVEEIQ